MHLLLLTILLEMNPWDRKAVLFPSPNSFLDSLIATLSKDIYEREPI